MQVERFIARHCESVVDPGAWRGLSGDGDGDRSGAERRDDGRRRPGEYVDCAEACAAVSRALGPASWIGDGGLFRAAECKSEPEDQGEPQVPPPPPPSSQPVAAAATSTAKQPFLPPCRVCSGPASGFHYGVNTCEACKGFFHRSLQRKAPYQCSRAGVCDIRLSERNSCAACRYQRCLRAGMAKEGVKTGRYTHYKRTCDTLEIKRIQSILAVHGTEATKSGLIIDKLAAAFTEYFHGSSLFYVSPGKVEAMKKTLLLSQNTKSVDRIMFGGRGGSVQPAKGRADHAAGVFRRCADAAAAAATAAAAAVAASALFQQGGDPSAREMHELWNREVESLIRAIVKFAKSVPGYSQLSLHDQIALIKAGRAELICLVKYKVYDAVLKCLADVRNDCLALMPARYLRDLWQDDDYADACLRSTRRLQSLALSVADVALLMAIVLLSPDRDGLEDAPAVQAAQEALLPALRRSISTSHPHDLSVHADALLLLAQLRELSEMNGRVLANLYQRSPAGFVPLIMECLPQRPLPCGAALRR